MHKKLNPGYFSSRNLRKLGFKNIGEEVFIAKDAIIVGFENISIGNNVKIDSNVTFAAISGLLSLGSNIHIGGGSHFSCSGSIQIEDFVTISQGVKIYSASDDYSGESLTNPTIPGNYKKVQKEKVIINKHVIIGSNSVILPGSNLEVGSAVGALSLVNGDLEAWSIYAGNPIRKIRDRSKNLLELEKQFLSESN